MSYSGPEDNDIMNNEAEEELGESLSSDEKSDKEDIKGDDDKKKRKDDIKIKKIISKPRPKLDPIRICGERGLCCLKDNFTKVKFKGEGREFEDLELLLSKYKYWTNRLMPNMKFEDVIEKIENLGHKREVKFHLRGLYENKKDEQEPTVDRANNNSGEENENEIIERLFANESITRIDTELNEEREEADAHNSGSEDRTTRRAVDIIRELEENEENENIGDDDLYDDGSRNERKKSKRKEKKKNDEFDKFTSPKKRVNVLETLENESQQKNSSSDLFDDDADDEISPKIVKKRTILINSDDDDEKKETENGIEMRLVLNDSDDEENDKESAVKSRRQARIIESDDEDQILGSLII